jgi:glycerol-3-phosphate dehydrogenase
MKKLGKFLCFTAAVAGAALGALALYNKYKESQAFDDDFEDFEEDDFEADFSEAERGYTSLNIDDKTDKSTSCEFFESIYDIAEKSVFSIPKNKTITSFCGLRSVGSTGDFIINMPKYGFINLVGIESPGLTSAPAIAEYVVAMLSDIGAVLSLRTDFVGTRRPMHFFREMSIEEKNKIIKEHPEYAHVICRCETVTEGEILDAIRTNPRPTDVDGVKRRTRASMGRCQGGFCTPYIIELLAKEMGVDYTAVTKFGGNSVINFGKTK